MGQDFDNCVVRVCNVRKKAKLNSRKAICSKSSKKLHKFIMIVQNRCYIISKLNSFINKMKFFNLIFFTLVPRKNENENLC